MRKLTSVYEPIGDGTKDRGEESFCPILEEDLSWQNER